MARDNNRDRVYKAEGSVTGIERILDKPTARAFFKHVARALEIPELKLRFRAGGARSFYQHERIMGDTTHPCISINVRVKSGILHEIAHHLVYQRYGHADHIQSHGREFVGIVSALYVLFLGSDPVSVRNHLGELS